MCHPTPRRTRQSRRRLQQEYSDLPYARALLDASGVPPHPGAITFHEGLRIMEVAVALRLAGFGKPDMAEALDLSPLDIDDILSQFGETPPGRTYHFLRRNSGRHRLRIAAPVGKWGRGSACTLSFWQYFGEPESEPDTDAVDASVPPPPAMQGYPLARSRRA